MFDLKIQFAACSSPPLSPPSSQPPLYYDGFGRKPKYPYHIDLYCDMLRNFVHDSAGRNEELSIVRDERSRPLLVQFGFSVNQMSRTVSTAIK